MDDPTRKAMRLWALAQPAVSAFITAVVRDFSDRDDVLQDVAVAVIDGFAAYDESRPFTPWAIGVARNQIGLYLRRRKRDRHTFDSDAVANLASAFDAVAEDEAHLLDRLRVCVSRLDTRSRRLCQLRYRDDLKPAAIAEVLSMTANGVSKALQRVRAQLRICLEGPRAVARG
ncbi:MAG TPA: RNA polymerase factor sigma-70 [Planctomycetaceae bacterium]|jgi:RNA polymerase sigma-70 factor (ECF subfamily)|nr:RNA polymerase factor sigma-70 [Planctomycetaceae bacterium]